MNIQIKKEDKEHYIPQLWKIVGDGVVLGYIQSHNNESKTSVFYYLSSLEHGIPYINTCKRSLDLVEAEKEVRSYIKSHALINTPLARTRGEGHSI